MPVIGFLHPASPEPFARLVAAFHEGLHEAGYFEGQNIKIEYRWAGGRDDRLNDLAVELVDRQVALIAAVGGMRSAQAAKAATTTIPVLFISGSDPVQAGFVASINRPGGNATGVGMDTTEMIVKRLEMLREFIPADTKIAMLVSPQPIAERFETEFAEKIGMLVLNIAAGKEFDQAQYERAFDTARKNRAGALLISADPFFTDRRDVIVGLATRHGLPAVYPYRQYVVAGGLASYGPDIVEAYRQIGRYAGRILKGTKPGDLPVQLPAKFEMVINLKTARTLGLTVPRIMLARASELIE